MAATDPQKQDWLRGDSALKGAMLSLLLKRPLHAYGLAGRLNRVFGPAWRIEPKSLYPKLEQLEREGLVISGEGSAADRMAGRVVYTATSLARPAVAEWIARTGPRPPVRSELQAKIIASEPSDAPALLLAFDVYELSCLDLLRSTDAAGVGRLSWVGAIMNVVRAAATAQLDADLAWVRAARLEIKEAAELYPPD